MIIVHNDKHCAQTKVLNIRAHAGETRGRLAAGGSRWEQEYPCLLQQPEDKYPEWLDACMMSHRTSTVACKSMIMLYDNVTLVPEAYCRLLFL